MAHTTNNNPSSTGDSSSSEPELIKIEEQIIIYVPVLEDLNFRDCSIYKVPCNLRKVKEEAYTPMFISIGPIHFDKDELKPMQEHKLMYLKSFRNRNGISTKYAVDKYGQYLWDEQEKIRQCYAEKFPQIPRDKFVKMMLLDSAFIMELLLRNWERKSDSHKHEQDLILTQPWLSRSIARDLILLENQIPFSVLEKLYDDVVVPNDQIPFSLLEKLYDDVVVPKFVDLATEYFLFYDTQMSDERKEHYRCVSSCTSKERSNSNGRSSTEHFIVDPIRSNSQETFKPKNKKSPKSPKHFTDLKRFLYIHKRRDSNRVCYSDSDRVCDSDGVSSRTSKEHCNSNGRSSTEHFIVDPIRSNSQEILKPKNKISPKHFTDLKRFLCIHKRRDSDGLLLRTATKLRDSGVSFEKSDAKEPLLRVTFHKTPILRWFLCFGCFPCLKIFKARLKIPQLKVDQTTECVFRNLIAFEQRHYPLKPYICNYVSLIDSLIHTQVDVDMLVEKEVIMHELGSDKEVATLVNGLCKHVATNTTCYSETINDLNDHYLNRWYRSMAALRLVYFRDCWRASSTVVGIVVLLFAVVQFLRALPVVLSRYHV